MLTSKMLAAVDSVRKLLFPEPSSLVFVSGNDTYSEGKQWSKTLIAGYWFAVS